MTYAETQCARLWLGQAVPEGWRIVDLDGTIFIRRVDRVGHEVRLRHTQAGRLAWLFLSDRVVDHIEREPQAFLSAFGNLAREAVEHERG